VTDVLQGRVPAIRRRSSRGDDVNCYDEVIQFTRRQQRKDVLMARGRGKKLSPSPEDQPLFRARMVFQLQGLNSFPTPQKKKIILHGFS
jgi:hypothetical protein